MKPLLSVLTCCLCLSACGNTENSRETSTLPDDPPPAGTPTTGPVWETIFASDFEEGDPMSEGWTRVVEQTPGDQPPSRVTLTQEKAHSGRRAARFYAGIRGRNPRMPEDHTFEAKAELVKRNLLLREGELVRIEAWYWLPPDQDHHGRVLMDLECGRGRRECGYVGQLGLRLFLDTALGYPTIRTNAKWRSRDRGITRRRGNRPVPLGKWFKLSWWIKLGAGSKGWTRIYLDDELLIAARGSTIHPEGLDRLDRYTTLQVGLTANGGLSETTIYVDDVRLDRCMAGCAAPPEGS